MAHEWRRSCSRIVGSFAASKTALNARVAFRKSIGVPMGGVLTGGSESKFYMRISDTRDGTPLWTDMTGEAGLVSNSGKRLVSNLRKRMSGE